jgi:hypothetical protein
MIDMKERQADLYIKLGALFDPLLTVLSDPGRFSTQDRAEAFAKFYHDAGDFQGMFEQFTKMRPGYDFRGQFVRVLNHINNFVFNVNDRWDNVTKLNEFVRETFNQIRKAVGEIQVDPTTGIRPSSSPFSTYCTLKDLATTTFTAQLWVDRYLDASVFHRYLRGLSDDVEVTLISWSRAKRCRGAKDTPQYTEFIDVSRLYAAERGPARYRLIENEEIHDRWLRCDNQLLHLGGSAKDAGDKSPYTLSVMEPTEANFQALENLISGGTELFGPNHPTHP